MLPTKPSGIFFTAFSLGIFNTLSLHADERPNILLIMADDWSWPHAGAYGCEWVDTPNFDKLASEGLLLHNVFASAPSCAPSRFSILTGRLFFQNEEGAIHGGFMPEKFPLYTHLLQEDGYHVGWTGKGSSPFQGRNALTRTVSPGEAFGKSYNSETISPDDVPVYCFGNHYTANLKKFLQDRAPGQPFAFAYNSWEPHRPYLNGAAKQNGYDINRVKVPPFMPDFPSVRADLAEYAYEVNYFDKNIGVIIDMLKSEGLFENTLIVITADQGMPFPHAKMHCYEFGLHVPMLIVWPKKIKKSRDVFNMVSLPQLAPTFLKLAGVPVPVSMTVKDITNIISGKIPSDNLHNEFVIWGKEKHNPAREMNTGYPVRAIRTHDFLYVHNFEPERWPAGDPPYFYDYIWEGRGDEYHELAMRYIMQNRHHPVLDGFFRMYTQKRPAHELFDIRNDPWCLVNLTGNELYSDTLKVMKSLLFQELRTEKDPRIFGDGELFENTPSAFLNRERSDGNPSFKDFPGRGEYINGLRRFDHSDHESEATKLRQPKVLSN